MSESRRSFLKKSGAAVAAFTILPRIVFGKMGGDNNYVAPSDQITKGIIGTGGIGRSSYHFTSDERCRLISVCDVDKNHLQKALDRRTARITVNNAWAECDPAYQTPKAFSAKVRMFDGSVVTLSAKEGQAVDLPRAELPALSYDRGDGCLVPFEGGVCRVVRADGSSDDVAASVVTTTLAGPWNVSFPGGWGMPGQMTIDALKPWKALGTTPEAKAFSGTADYTIDFTLDKLDEGAIVVLDLGRVESLAKVEVNGRDFGDLWSKPYRIPLTGAVKAGKNTLKVSVTDTWYNRLVFDAGQPQAKRRTWTIAGPKKGSALRDSGLLGPVKVMVLR